MRLFASPTEWDVLLVGLGIVRGDLHATMLDSVWIWTCRLMMT